MNMVLTGSNLAALLDTFFNRIKTREDVLDFEAYVKSLPTAYDKCPYEIFHSFAGGMYTREMHATAGDLIVGAIHKKEYFVNVLKGKIVVVSEFGAKLLTAPCSFKAPAGVKHIGYTLEDTVWSDTTKTDKLTVAEAEADIFATEYSDIDGYIAEATAIQDVIVTKESSIEIKPSSIHGFGVFTTKPVSKGGFVTLARNNNSRTLSGRYVNHSCVPNVIPVADNDRGIFIAAKDLPIGIELTADYNEVVTTARSMSCQVG